MREERMYLMSDYLRYPKLITEMITEHMNTTNTRITKVIYSPTEIFITFKSDTEIKQQTDR